MILVYDTRTLQTISSVMIKYSYITKTKLYVTMCSSIVSKYNRHDH